MKIKSVFQSGAVIAGMLIAVGCAGRNESEISGIVSQALGLPAFLPTGALPEKILPDGAVALDERYFPDEAFREYLYQYYDQDKDYILTREERQVLFKLGDVDYRGKTDEEKTERKELLKRVRSFEGIAYLENLRTIVLGEEYAAKELHLNNSKLEAVVISCTGLKALSVEGAPGLKRLVCQECESMYIQQDSVENLEELKICARNPVELAWDDIKNLKSLELSISEGPAEIDLSGMQELERVSLTNITADFSLLLQNKSLTSIFLQDCRNLQPQEEMDFSGLENLQKVRVLMQEAPKEYWAKRMIFGDGFQNAYEWENWIELRCGIAGQVVLGNKGVCCRIEGDEKACEIIYLDEIREAGQTLPEGNVWNGAENFQDLGLRRYLYYFFDTDKDNILTGEERGAVTRIMDTGYDYDATAAWNNKNAWKIEDDVSQDIIGLTSLQGMEYFPMLRRLQLVKMALSAETTEIVLNLPNLEILELRFNGNVKTIDLTACKNLRICVIDSDRDADFVQEVKPEILLPEHLQLETRPGLDCVVGV